MAYLPVLHIRSWESLQVLEPAPEQEILVGGPLEIGLHEKHLWRQHPCESQAF